MAGATLQPIYERLNGTSQYHPFSAETFQDWSLEAGDVISVSKGEETYSSPVFVSKMKWTGHPMNNLEATGDKQRQAISRQSKQKFAGGGGGVNNSKALYYLTQDFDDQKGQFTQYITGPNGLIQSVMWQKHDDLGAIAGDFTKDSSGNYRLASGSQFLVNKNGTYQTVGTEAQITTVQNNVDGVNTRVQTIEGSTLWTQRNDITGVVGEFEVVTNPTTGVKTIVVKSGGGMSIRRNNVEYGLYDSGNLTAGVIVQKINSDSSARASLGFYDDGNLTAGILVSKINGGASSVKISADHIVLDGEAVASSLEAQEIVAKSVSVTNNLIGTNLIAHNSLSVEGDAEVEGDISATSFYMGDQDLGDGFVNVTKTTSGNDITLTFTTANGDEVPVTFNKSSTPTLTGSWSGAHLSVSSDPAPTASLNYYFGHLLKFDDTNPNLVVLTSDWRTSPYSPTGTQFDSGSFDVTSRYNAGWGDAQSKVVAPSSSTSSTQMTVKVPSSTVGQQTSLVYTLQSPYIDGSNSYVNLNDSNGTAVARVGVGGVYNTGWAVAYGRVSLPGASTTSSSMQVKTPPATVGGTATTTTYTLSPVLTQTTDSYVNLNNSGGTTVARVSVGSLYTTGYNAGVSSVHPTLIDYWTGGGVRTISSPSAVEELNRKIGQGQVSWSGNVASGDIVVSFDGGSTFYAFGSRYSVDATARYNAGQTDGWNVAVGKVSAPAYGTGTTFSVGVPDSTYNTSRNMNFTIAKGATPGSSGYASVALSGTLVGRIEIGDWYDAGYTAGYNAGSSGYTKAHHPSSQSMVSFRLYAYYQGEYQDMGIHNWYWKNG